MLSITELRKKMASARRNSAVIRKQENLVKSVRVKKCVSNVKAGKTHPIQGLQGKVGPSNNLNPIPYVL
jgi:ABC-type phosphate/phosphonate transport system ATPase subunit